MYVVSVDEVEEVKQNLMKDGHDEAGLQKRVMETMLEKRDLHAEQ